MAAHAKQKPDIWAEREVVLEAGKGFTPTTVAVRDNREIACEMKCRMEELEPELGRLIEATPPWVEDPLRR